MSNSPLDERRTVRHEWEKRQTRSHQHNYLFEMTFEVMRRRKRRPWITRRALYTYTASVCDVIRTEISSFEDYIIDHRIPFGLKNGRSLTIVEERTSAARYKWEVSVDWFCLSIASLWINVVLHKHHCSDETNVHLFDLPIDRNNNARQRWLITSRNYLTHLHRAKGLPTS